jgi:hypothetical protein
MRPPCVRIDVVRVCVCFPPYPTSPLRLCLHPTETVSPPPFFPPPSSFSLLVQVVSRPTSRQSGPWPSPCRVAPARSTRVLIFVVSECVSVLLRGPRSSSYTPPCVCVLFCLVRAFRSRPPMRKDQKKIISLKIEKHRNSTRNRLISPRLVPRRHLTVSPFQNCQKNNNNNFWSFSSFYFSVPFNLVFIVDEKISDVLSDLCCSVLFLSPAKISWR